ncbi:MAG: HAMP domain-containing protein [Magnetococcales bacterium]|nr:HAMP domain-containing protein [Magnetococcales bacterium]NGZ05295.1 HAMP domain-containing protein [Magnetococcales bacterium]
MGYILGQLKNITFTKKLYYLIFILLILFAVIFISLYWFSKIDRQESDKSRLVTELSERMWNLAGRLHELNGHVIRYILHREEMDREWVEKHRPELTVALDYLLDEFSIKHLSEDDDMLIDDLREDWTRYLSQVDLLFNQTNKYGKTHEYGIQKEMREIAHHIEKKVQPFPDLIWHLMNIRRAEKDFMLRVSNEYISVLHNHFNDMISDLQISEIDDRLVIEESLIQYLIRFCALVQMTFSISAADETIHMLWDDMARDISALRIAARHLSEQEQYRHDQAVYQLHSGLKLGVIVIFLVMSSLLSAIFYGNILKPIRQLTERARAIAHGQYDWDISLSGRDEIGILAKHLQMMKETLKQTNHSLEQQVEQRTRLLVQKNKELHQSLEQLQQTRDELVQSEKMASLGRLVAGFAHEINTPIGIGVGSVSALPEYVAKLEVLLAADEVDGDALDAVFVKIREMSQLCLNNLRAVSDLVVRFKRISVDQTSEQPRRFKMHEFLQDVTSSLHHLLKRSMVQLTLICPESVEIRSHPGALGQILTNLIINSVKHGFADGSRPGTIKIEVGLDVNTQGKLLTIWYTDDGLGMAPEVLRQIFDPFFTTARQNGGSGLGLYICYNIVRSQLQGKIVCSSIPGQMTSFLIEIPLVDDDHGQENYT